MCWNEIHEVIQKFVEAFESARQTSIQVDRQVKATSLFEAGEGVYSGALRLEFYTAKGASSVFVHAPWFGARYEEGLKLSLYEKETFMYSRILSAMYENWPLGTFSPVCYVSTESGVLVVENLRESGFQTLEDLLADPALCMAVFSSLAQFHGLSRLHLDRVPPDGLILSGLEVEDRGRYVIRRASVHALVKKFRTRLIRLLSTDVRRLFENMIRNLPAIVHDAHASHSVGFNVIVRGNANRTNVFLPSAGARVTRYSRSCKFVNFQESRLGPPVIDMITFLITSVEFEVSRGHLDLLFNYYLDELNAILLAANSQYPNVYTLGALRADLRRYKMYFVYELVFKVPMYWTRFAKVEVDLRNEDEYDRLLKNERFIIFFKNWMEVFLTW